LLHGLVLVIIPVAESDTHEFQDPQLPLTGLDKSSSMPPPRGQGAPPLRGIGLLHSLVLVFLPVLESIVQGCQDPQPPFTRVCS